MSNKKILVLGGAGYVGSVLVPFLLERGYSVRVVDALIFDQPPLATDAASANLEFIKGDLRNYQFLESVLKDIDIIINLAALVGEPACRLNPSLSYAVNRDLVDNLNNLRGDIPLIFISTVSVYGETGGKMCFEDTEPKPVLDYAKSKYEAEKIIKQKDNYLILRPATAFGLSPKMQLDTLINDFVFRAVKQGYLEVHDPHFFRTFVHIKDLAGAILLAVEKFSELKNQVFNVGANQLNATKLEIANLIKSQFDFELKIVPGSNEPDKKNFIVNYDKIQKAGFQAKISLAEGISELIEAFKNIEDNPSFYNVNYKLV